MIRFRLGQRWKAEHESSLEDSFGLELDGIDLLPETSEESLAIVVPELLDAVAALYSRGEPLAQVSLPEAHLEIAMCRRENEIEICIVDLGRPARVARGPVRVDLVDLSTAAIQCAKGLMQRVRHRQQLHNSAPIQQMMRQVGVLEHRRMAAAISASAAAGVQGPAPGPTAELFRFDVGDSRNLIAAFGKGGRGPLAALLFEGSVSLAADRCNVIWRAEGKPFLVTLEICRQAAELLRARELGEERIAIQLGGVGPPFELDLLRGRIAVASRDYELSGVALERAMLELGLSMAYFVFAQNRNQRKNPYLAALIERCRDGLAQLRAPIATNESGLARAPGGRVAQTAVNLAGRLRRLRFSELWKKSRLGGDELGRLLLGAKGPIFSSAAMACAFSRRGELLFRRISAQGVAVSKDYWALAAGSHRMDCFVNSSKTASWTRDYVGTSIGPSLIRKRGLLIGTSAAGAIFALSELTGRETWRIALARARDVFCSTQGQRLLIAADSGELHGVDLHNGDVRYRLRASQPFTGPPLAWGRRFLARAGRRDRLSLLAADAHQGTLHWTREVELTRPASPVAQGNRVFIAGERGPDGVVVCLAATGQPLWERGLHLGHGPFTLVAASHRVIACSPRGGAVCFDSDGQAVWRLGELSAELLWPCPPALARGVIIIPGEVVRAVDVHSGAVLAELPAGIGLCDLKADSKLSLFLLDEDGTLQAHRLASHFAVVPGEPQVGG